MTVFFQQKRENLILSFQEIKLKNEEFLQSEPCKAALHDGKGQVSMSALMRHLWQGTGTPWVEKSDDKMCFQR